LQLRFVVPPRQSGAAPDQSPRDHTPLRGDVHQGPSPIHDTVGRQTRMAAGDRTERRRGLRGVRPRLDPELLGGVATGAAGLFDLRWTGYPAPFEANFPYFRRSSMSPGDACSKPASAACSTAPLGISATWTQRTPARSISTRTISCSCSRSRRAPAHLDDRSAS